MVEARLQLSLAKRPVTGCFSFADVPQLTRALRDGNEEAFRWVHGEWNSRLFRYSFALAAGDEVVAGEITQAAYLRLFRHIRELPNENALWNWLARAARSAASDLRKTRGRYQGALSRFADWWASFIAPSEPDVLDHEKVLTAALDTALAKLDEADRELLNGRYFQQRPLAEMAKEQQTTARAIEGRLARLRTRLRAAIQTELKRTESPS
ncbi:MAG: RNA polymerase sigma factor [Limisphaerales bacterium]